MHCGVFLVWLLGIASSAGAAVARPNILWITVEDMSPQLGCYGDRTVPTPNVDRLAAEGVRFTRAFSTYGVCAPSRASLITGMYPTSIGAMHMRTMKRTAALDAITDPELLAIPVYEAVPPPQVKCFPEYLRAAGYYCSNNAKEDYQFIAPVTAWNESGSDAHWKNRPTPETPFFAVFNFEITHESRVFEQVSPQVVDPATVTVPPYYPDTELVRRDIARNYDNIAEMDRQVGELLKELEAEGLMEKTIIFFFSDHGSGLPRAKRWVYDSGIHVPLIIRFPGQREAGTTNGDLVSFVDFAPTMLSLLDLPIPDHLQGQAFLGARKATPRRYVFAFRDRMDPAAERIRAVRDQRFKYVRNYRPELPYLGFVPYRDRMELMQEILRLSSAGELGPDQWQFTAKRKPLEELYDTASDPHEIRNLAGDPVHFEKLAELREIHEAFHKRYGDLGELSETNLIRKLWPPAGIQPETLPPLLSVVESRGGVEVRLEPQTPGASLAWRTGTTNGWQLYHQPIQVEKGVEIRALAHRIGFKPSTEVVHVVE
ncbi:MAG TPA: sulfatase [Verrucomicrobiales bacterium]|nr:sulfatase [Verrucomicrobiales bacterium]